jgi:ABC-2 type transport system permease protein
MNGSWSIFVKEFRGHIRTPMAYVMAFVFLILIGYFFQESMNQLNRYTREYPMRIQQINAMRQMNMQAPNMPPPPNIDQSVVQRTYGTMSFLLIFIIPILTMRSFSEEYRSGTIELLWTSPTTSSGILAGKFFGSLSLYVGILTLTLVHVAMAAFFSEADAGPDFGLIVASYIGMFLLGATFISVGLFASSLSENQIISAVISFSLLLFFLVIGTASSYVGNYKAGEFLRYLSVSGHIDSFLQGVIRLRDVVYYLSFTGFMLFLTDRVLESRRWRA